MGNSQMMFAMIQFYAIVGFYESLKEEIIPTFEVVLHCISWDCFSPVQANN